MIPKIIHYCWFGGNEKPKLFKKCYESWKKHCPDYEIIEWNESNFDLTSCPLYVRQAYQAKKWAFVTDYVRLKVVYDNGGIYFDTDVELRKNTDFLLEYKAFFGFENREYVATGLGFGAEKGTKILQELLQDYEEIPFVREDGSFDITPCPQRNTQVFLRHGLVQDDSKQIIENNILILPTEVLCPADYMTGELKITKNTIAIHWFSASWYENLKYDTLVEKKKAEKKIQKRKNIKDRLLHLPNYILLKVLGKNRYNRIKFFWGR